MSLPIHPAGPPRVLAVDLPACRPAAGRPSGLAPPPPGADHGLLPRRRDRSGLTQVVTDAELPDVAEEAVLRVTGTVTHNPVAPGGVELTAPSVEVLAEPVAPPAVELWRPTLTAALPMLLDHAAWPAPPPPAGPVAAVGRRPAGFRATLDALGFTEIHTPKIVGLGHRVRARTSSRSTTSAGRPTWPSRRSSTSRRWSASSSGSTRSGRCSGPSRTTPPGTWPSTPRSTPSWASSPTTAT